MVLTIGSVSIRTMVSGSDSSASPTRKMRQLAARVAAAEAHAYAEIDVAVADFALPAVGRLDDRMCNALTVGIDGFVASIDTAMRGHVERLLAEPDRADHGVMRLPDEVMVRLRTAGVLHDRELVSEIIARIRFGMIGDMLPIVTTDADEPSFLVRLAHASDARVANAALAVLAADSRERDARRRGISSAEDLPPALQRHLVWSVAAALRPDDVSIDVDRALAGSAICCLASWEAPEHLDSAMSQLAAAINPLPADIPGLITASIGDRRLGLFIVLLAQALSLSTAQIRAMVIDPTGDRLWLALHGAGLKREEIAAISLSLADADPRRDLELAWQQIEAIVAVPRQDAVAALGELTLPAEYRSAIRTIDR